MVTNHMKQGKMLQNLYDAAIEFTDELKERYRALKKFDKICFNGIKN